MSAIPASVLHNETSVQVPVAVVCRTCGTENATEIIVNGERQIRDSCEFCGNELVIE